MTLWEMIYTLTDRWHADTWRSYVWSTTAPTAATIQHYWNVIHPNNYTVSDFWTRAVPQAEINARPDANNYYASHIVKSTDPLFPKGA